MGPRAGLDGCGKSRPQAPFDPRTVQPAQTAMSRPIACQDQDPMRTVGYGSRGLSKPTQLLVPSLNTKHTNITHSVRVGLYALSVKNRPNSKRCKIKSCRSGITALPTQNINCWCRIHTFLPCAHKLRAADTYSSNKVNSTLDTNSKPPTLQIAIGKNRSRRGRLRLRL